MSHATLCFLSYERPEFLQRAITTAITGCNEPVEVIVHDDGSTNRELLKLLYTLHQKGAVSSVILNAPGVNQGQGVALNRMFRMATGDPIIKLDQDLIFKPGWLEGVRRILADPLVGLLGLFKYLHEPVDWRRTLISDHDLATGHFRSEAKAQALGCLPVDRLPRGYSFHTHICGSGFAVPRSVWNIIGPFEERWDSFGEDWEFQRDIHAHPVLFNALPDEDLVENIGFGIGPSTVVIAGPEGPEPAKIHKLPMLVGGH